MSPACYGLPKTTGFHPWTTVIWVSNCFTYAYLEMLSKRQKLEACLCHLKQSHSWGRSSQNKSSASCRFWYLVKDASSAKSVLAGLQQFCLCKGEAGLRSGWCGTSEPAAAAVTCSAVPLGLCSHSSPSSVFVSSGFCSLFWLRHHCGRRFRKCFACIQRSHAF